MSSEKILKGKVGTVNLRIILSRLKALKESLRKGSDFKSHLEWDPRGTSSPAHNGALFRRCSGCRPPCTLDLQRLQDAGTCVFQLVRSTIWDQISDDLSKSFPSHCFLFSNHDRTSSLVSLSLAQSLQPYFLSFQPPLVFFLVYLAFVQFMRRVGQLTMCK